MDKIKLVILGAAHPHADIWAQAWQTQNEAELVGVWDHNEERARSLAEKIGVEAFTSLEAALDSGRADAVAICAENRLHSDLTVAAAEKGRDILCEKPAATTIAGCDRMAQAIEKAGVRYMQGFPMRVDPVNYKIKELLESGSLGTVTTVRKRHGIGWAAAMEGRLPERMLWFTKQEQSGGGALMDEGVHAMDFLRWMFGDPIAVQAVIPESVTGLEVEDNATAVFEFPGGMTAVLQTSWTFQAGTNSTEIFGTRGTLIQQFNDCASTAVNGESNFPLQVYSSESGQLGWWMPRIPTVFQEIHERVARRFVHCLVSGEGFPSTLEDGRAALRMVLAAYEAAHTGKRVELKEG